MDGKPELTEYTGFVFHDNGIAVVLDSNGVLTQVRAKRNSVLPQGLSICRIARSECQIEVECIRACNDLSALERAAELKSAWDNAQAEREFQSKALQQPFIALDIESDGARIWEAALYSADSTQCWSAAGHERCIAEIQRKFNELSPQHILVGHNIEAWDLVILKRHGIVLPEAIHIWDTLKKEHALTKIRGYTRPSYALRTAHSAEADAQQVLELARNQWFRKNAPKEIAEKAWNSSPAFFVIPNPAWKNHAPSLNTDSCNWDRLLQEYASLDDKKISQDVKSITWGTTASIDTDVVNAPFNPASPKRVDYWYRLLPAIDAVSKASKKTILFVQHNQEINCLVDVIPQAFTGDVRRSVRRLGKHGGVLVLHDNEWSRTLAEGVPKNTALILEKAPERTQDQDDSENETADDTETAENAGESGDTANDLTVRPRMFKSRPIPHLPELGKMALWSQLEDMCSFVCLDARVWNRRGAANFKIETVRTVRREVVSLEHLSEAGFRQATGEWALKENWESEIAEWFGVSETGLKPFQISKLTKILPRSDYQFEYVERATGGGKSLIFQAAALYRGLDTRRLTIVISPLRALIHDQVNKLHEMKFALDVEALSGDMNRAEIEDAYRRIAGGETTMVYTAPERFRSKGFLGALETRLALDHGGEPEFWVFDEAHCISLWGLEFRPDYRKAAAYIRKRNKAAGADAAPVLLVSATLTRLAKDDIETVLGFA